MPTVMTIPVLRDNFVYLLIEGERAICIDAGEAGPVIAAIRDHKLTLDAILITHTHYDHIDGLTALHDQHPCPIMGPSDLDHPATIRHINDDTELVIDGATLQAIKTPGHCPHHFAYHTESILFSGDVLLTGACGRILGGTPSQLWQSLNRLMHLPADTKVYCGHEYTEDNLRFALSILPDDPAITQQLANIQARLSQGDPSGPVRLDDEIRTNIFLRSGNADVAQALNMANADAEQVFIELRRRKDHW
ncbi:MAG: hydroxyacylglutathione hydrolase [Kiritimatiellae bacterium]|nr:hydroxyacylglutathione hydrolase [Kiritimatiellia bacterium]